MADGTQEDAVELVVREARARDAGRGIVRLPEAARRQLGVLSGDAVRLVGERTTAAKVWPADADLGDDELRIDGETRANAGVRIGDAIRVRPGRVADAERVVLAPATSLPDDPADAAAAAKRALLGRPVASGERVRVDAFGAAREFRVVDTVPGGIVSVTETTGVDVEPSRGDGQRRGGRRGGPAAGAPAGGDSDTGGDSAAGDTTDDDATGDDATGDDAAEPAADAPASRPVGTTYEDVGGLDDELEQVRELVELPLSRPDLFRRLGVEPPKGVLLYGPPGTGKTLIARAVAGEADAHFRTVSGPEITSKYKGEAEAQLREIFEEARENAPAVIFFDEIDAVAARRDDDSDMETRIVAQLLSLMDGLQARGDVIVIGATNRVDAIDPALRRPGRFDREIEIGVPGETGRKEILEIHTRGMPLAEDVDLDRLAARTHGFVGADLRALATEAGMRALRRVYESGEEEGAAVSRDDFESALAATGPSAMREYVAEFPETSFDDVGGLDDAKATLRETVEWPLSYPELFEATATDPPTGILLYGPPGTGKTLLARAIAHESGVNFIRVAGPELLDKYVGESERAVRELFDRARQAAPAIVFFDEIDAIASRRGDSEVGERVVSQLLTELDGAAANPSLVVLAATNRVEAIDPALLRPGRIETHIEIPPPDEAARRAILRVHTRRKPLGDVDFDALAAELDGYTGADIEALVRAASMRAIREAADEYGVAAATERASEVRITGDHFAAAREGLDRSRRTRNRSREW